MKITNNNLNSIWDIIINKINKKIIEIQTIKLNGEMGIWFSVNILNNKLIIEKSINNIPSSKLKHPRKINKNEFLNIYQYYFKWKNREINRYKLRNKSRNTSYILSIINYFEKIIEGGTANSKR